MKTVKVFLLASVIGVLSGCFSDGPKVMIETPQPEDDFVVVCSWSSHGFGLHGGKSRVKESVFVASSGEIVDCGMSIFGDDSLVQIQHLLYRNHSACAREETCSSKSARIEDGILIITPKSKQQELDEVIKNLSGRNLVEAAKRLGGNFPDDYLGYYSSQRKVSVAHFKSAYEDRLKKHWEILTPIITGSFSNPVLNKYTSDDFVNRYWETAKKYEK